MVAPCPAAATIHVAYGGTLLAPQGLFVLHELLDTHVTAQNNYLQLAERA
jgi:hypothetical protein